MDILIRKATTADLDLVTHIEATCFPPAEAAPREAFKERLDHYAGQFLIAFDGDTPIGFIDGFVTDDEVLTDEMFADASLHNPHGAWQMIFGLNTLPEYRNRGVGGKLIEAFIDLAREEKRKGVILTCKEEKIPYYAKFGFVNEGESESDHGGAKWYQMRIVFQVLRNEQELTVYGFTINLNIIVPIKKKLKSLQCSIDFSFFFVGKHIKFLQLM